MNSSEGHTSPSLSHSRAFHGRKLAPEAFRESSAHIAQRIPEGTPGTMTEEPRVSQEAHGSYIAQATTGASATVNVYQNVAPQVVDQATIRSAQERIATLPIDRLPARSPLPSGSRMPFWANPLFVGREVDLQWLAQVLKANGSGEGKIAAITGLGGIGKTQLATEFVHRYGQYFAGGVFWMSFSEESMVATQVAECGRPGHLNLHHQYGGLPLEDQVRLVLGAWQSQLPRLLVFDNCEDEKLLARWRPPAGANRILITSRRAQWDPTLGVEVLPLGVLQRSESIQLLRKHIQGLQTSDSSLAAVANELGDLPLALHLAGSFLNRYRHVQTLTGYLAQLRQTDILAHPSLTSGGRSATAHEQHLSRTFAVSYRHLDPTKPTDTLALTLLARATCFAPGEPIPHDLLLATLDLSDNQDIGLRQAEDSLLRLIEVGLVESVSDDGAIRLHRLVVAFLRKMISDPTAQDAVERALARNYEQSRVKLPSGTHRTIILDQQVDRMRSFVSQVGYTSADILRLFRLGSAGYRILALVAVGSFPDQSCFSIVLEAIRHSRSAFEQYYALLAARTMLPVINEGQKDELLAMLRDETSIAYPIGQSTNRWLIRDRILTTLQLSGGTRPFVSSSLYMQTHTGSTKDLGKHKLLVVTAGTIAAGVGQEIMRQMDARPQSDLNIKVRYIDIASPPTWHSTHGSSDWFQISLPPRLMKVLYNNRATYPEWNRLLYPHLPQTWATGGGNIRYNGLMAAMIHRDQLKKWLSTAMINLIQPGDKLTNYSIALVGNAVGAAGSGSLECLTDVIAEIAQDTNLPTPVHMNIFILQPDRAGVSQFSLANTLALYAELAASRLARNDMRYYGRIVLVGWGSGWRFTSIHQLQETAASLIRLIHDPVSNLPSRYEGLVIEGLPILGERDKRTGLPTHLSSATPVTISLKGLEELIIQRDAARLLNNLIFGPEGNFTATRSDEMFVGTLATSIAGENPEERFHHLLQYLTKGADREVYCLSKNFQEQAFHSLLQEQTNQLEEIWRRDKMYIAQRRSAIQEVGHQLISEISTSWLHVQRDSMVEDSTLSLSSLLRHYERLRQILSDTLKFAREMAQTMDPDDNSVAARLQEVKKLIRVPFSRFFKKRRQRAIEHAIQAIQINLRTDVARQALPAAIEVLQELTARSSENFRRLRETLRLLEKWRRTMDNWGNIALRELKVGTTHPLELPALSDKKAVEAYYEWVSIFSPHTQDREKPLTEEGTMLDFRHWLSDPQNMDALFEGNIDLLLPVAQKYTRDKISKEGFKKYSVLDVLLQGGEEALHQRLASAAKQAQPLVNFNHSFAPECEEVWYICAYYKDENQLNTLKKAVNQAFPQGRCFLLLSENPTEIVVLYSVDGLPMSAVQDLTGGCLDAFLTLRKQATGAPQDALNPLYSSREAEYRVIQQGIICRLCRSIGKDISHYRDLPEMKDCES